MVVGLLVFRLGPVVVAFMAGFTKWNIQTAPELLGLANYGEAINSEIFWQVSKNTLIFTLIYVPGVMILALVMAVMVNQKIRGIAFFRGLYFLPYITAMVAVAMVWRWIFATRFGILNFVLSSVFQIADPPAWLADRAWNFLYEAAAIDGANRRTQFFKITLPLLSPVTFFVFIITVIDAFKTFDVTYAMTGGGPNYASTTLAYSIYQNAFVYGRMGYASALAMLLLVFVGVTALVSFKLKDRMVEYAL
jgi:multiple sugar transport system permease protein